LMPQAQPALAQGLDRSFHVRPRWPLDAIDSISNQ
jgi:hypothetical protein